MKKFNVIIGSAVLAAFVSACGQAAAPPAATPPPAPAAAPAAAAPAKTTSGKEIVLAPKAEIQTFKHEEAKVEIAIPANWIVTQDGNEIEVTSPGEEVYVSFRVLNSNEVKAGITELTDYINDEIPDIEMGEPTVEKVNGMPAWSIVGTSQAEGMAVGITLVETPANKLLALYAEATPAAEKFKAEIDAMDKGLKPIQ